jgi:hypothetical protein
MARLPLSGAIALLVAGRTADRLLTEGLADGLAAGLLRRLDGLLDGTLSESALGLRAKVATLLGHAGSELRAAPVGGFHRQVSARVE